MGYVIQHPNKTYMVKKDAWKTEWSDNLDIARIFPTKGAVTRALGSMNDGYANPISSEGFQFLEVELVVRRPHHD